MDPKHDFSASLGGQAKPATRNPEFQATGSQAGQVYASLGKWTAMGNPEFQAIGSWARRLDKWAAIGIPELQDTSSWARQVWAILGKFAVLSFRLLAVGLSLGRSREVGGDGKS